MLQDLIRVLCYTPHGGSGYTFTRRDVMEMGWGEALAHAEWLDGQRRREADAMRRGSRK